MSSVCPKPRCGGLLLLDREAGDEWVCARCSVRLYATQPDTHGRKTDPLFCPECGARVYGTSWTGAPPTCGDCADSKVLAVILRETPDMSRVRRRKSVVKSPPNG